MVMRKPPIRHKVKRHKRMDKWVDSFERGSGTRRSKHRVVGGTLENKGIRFVMGLDENKYDVLVYDNDKSIGFLEANVDFVDEGGLVYLFIRSFEINEEYRGRGIGQSTIDFAEKNWRDMGVKHITLDDETISEKGSFWERLGYIPRGSSKYKDKELFDLPPLVDFIQVEGQGRQPPPTPYGFSSYATREDAERWLVTIEKNLPQYKGHLKIVRSPQKGLALPWMIKDIYEYT